MVERLKSFKEVLSEAVNDLISHGFDSVERIEKWTRELRLAAERSLISEQSLEEELRKALADEYRRMVEMGGIISRHPGIDRFTLDKVRPHLRSELDRRILASASLIKLNRTEAIEKTLRRFQGWSTSIPTGGVSGESKVAVKRIVRKSLAQLPFEERRVLIDQGHKLVASISEIIAADGGAIAGIWHSHYRQAGYNFREDHKERDGKIFLVRDSWAHQAGLVKKGGQPFYDEITAAAQEPFCKCFVSWLYNLRDLPAENLTVKGKDALSAAQGSEEVRSARTARADDAESDMQITQAEAAYVASWPDKTTRCQRCTMFLRLTAGGPNNACSAVAGDITAHGHCRLFQIIGAHQDDADAPRPAVGYEAIRRRLERLKQLA